MGPSKSKISKADVRLGLRYAWHEEPDKVLVDSYFILSLGLLSFWYWLAIPFFLVFALSLGYHLYRGLAAARDARDFSAYIDEQVRPWRDPWLSQPADFTDDPE